MNFFSDFFSNMLLVLAMIVIVPPMAFTAGIMNLTDAITEMRNKIDVVFDQED